jgi:hypothetical protein
VTQAQCQMCPRKTLILGLVGRIVLCQRCQERINEFALSQNITFSEAAQRLGLKGYRLCN